MKNRIYIIIAFLFLSIASYSNNNDDVLILSVKAQTDSAEFVLPEFPNLKGWYLKSLSVPVDYTSGFKVKIEFSVPQNAIDKAKIFRLGGVYRVGNDYSFRRGYSLILQNNCFLTERSVSLEEKEAQIISYTSWDRHILERGCNYTLIFEIDETRLRITTYEDGNPDNERVEYEFNGLANSHLRTILSGYDTPGELYAPAICIDKRLPVRKLEVYELGSGVKVDDPQTSEPFVSYLKNSTGEVYMRPVGGDTENGVAQEVNNLSPPLWSMWEVKPLFDKNRKPSNYKSKIRNLQSNRFMVVQHASTAEEAPITQWADEGNNNSIWNVQFQSTGNLFMKSVSTNKYAAPRDGHTSYGARVVQYGTPGNHRSSWSFIPSSFDAPIATGYYKLKNRSTNLYLGLGSDFSYVRLEPFNNYYGTDNIWYVEKRPGGIYTMKNVYMNQYLFINFLKRKPYPYPYLDDIDPNYGLNGLYFWTFEKQGTAYQIVQAHHNEALVPEGSGVDTYCKLTRKVNPPSSNALWEFVPVDFSLNMNLGGFYKLKYAPTNQYLVVKNASKDANEIVVSYPTADTKNGWWYFIKTDLGGYMIYNVNSGLLLKNNPPTPKENGYCNQYYPEQGTNKKSEQWEIRHSNEMNKYIIYSYSGGKALAFDEPAQTLSQAVTRSQFTSSAKWFLEPITLQTSNTRSLTPESENEIDGMIQELPKNENVTINKIGGIEAFCIDNELLVKCDYIIKSIDILDVSSKLIGSYEVSNYFAGINASDLSSGEYIAVINTEELGQSKVKFTK